MNYIILIIKFTCIPWKAYFARIVSGRAWYTGLCWRQMFHIFISWIMTRTNDSVLLEVQLKTRLLCLIQGVKSFGHIARDEDCLEKVSMQGRLEGSRKSGRDRTRWFNQIKIFILLPRIVRGGVPLLISRAVSHDSPVESTNYLKVLFKFLRLKINLIENCF